MLRLRRYRVFLIFAVLSVFLIIHLRKTSDWSHPAHVQDFDSPPQHQDLEKEHVGASPAKTPPPVVQKESSKEAPLPTSSQIQAPKIEPTSSTVALPKSTVGVPIEPVPKVVLPDRQPVPPTKVNGFEAEDDIHAISPPGRQEYPNFSAEAVSTIHWVKQKEHFPVATESIIQLPTGAPVKIPRIQHKFNDETPDAKINREKRQLKVKQEFKKAWTGYRSKAWLHDELSPVSGMFRDPFCGWAATLVDTLDTLWIMGLHEEFEEAAKAVDLIDFTTSPRGDIPMFETTIRYLGGLLAAYDVSGAKYKNLLDKAVELAEILIGAFDTPNRMPVLYYYWMPTFASQPHRASTRSNLAELGSLSMEFTRLAQLTKEPKYYDAVARVTNALADFQSRGTKLDGVFPDNIDASGCNRTIPSLPKLPVAVNTQEPAVNTAIPTEAPVGYQPTNPEPDTVQEPIPKKASPKDGPSGPGTLEVQVSPGEASKARIVGWEETNELGNSKRKREIEADVPAVNSTTPTPTVDTVTGLPLDIPAAKAQIGAGVGDWDCVAQGLDSYTSHFGIDKFSMGGGQDSTYEYFPKQYLLLGGLDDTYRKMYIKTVDAIRKWMLYRPMLPDNRDILFSGSVTTYGDPATDLTLTAEVEHLTCFIGGMIGMGAQIFGIDGDLELAKKLADGCVWAYSATKTGIMPEGAIVLPCKSAEHCTWNETLYREYLDPMGDQRDKNLAEYEVNKKNREAELEAEKQQSAATQQPLDGNLPDEASGRIANSSDPARGGDLVENDAPVPLQKRQSSPKDDIPKPITHNFADDVPVKADTQKAQSVPASPPKTRTPNEQYYDQKSYLAESELENIATTSGHQVEKPLTDAQAPIVQPEVTMIDPMRPLTHEEYVSQRIIQEGLPPGFVSFKSKKYILRPEAIESVWYMYRITGDSVWQDKGWRMFESIINATSTEHGHSAIHDVTLDDPVQVDEMESFWLAETLKYFYLLYSTPDTISLDDWVLNTEAHPFKRPISV
ncbi:glycosyl hydrolase family 47-domain-containing protein [Rhexocercosporidium sp. MPI-PUGE-AT-0058]|nr:glycosyl hydrolase family 47-domain-containing protein [Rhexocercosporidium sp. MPI-PUGE-AT-0058]